MPSFNLAARTHNFSDDPMYYEIETTLIDGAGETTEDNLWCEVYIETFDIGDNVDQAIRLHLPYARTNKIATFNLAGLMKITAECPVSSILNVGAPGAILAGVLDHVRKVVITAADAYGIPLVAQTPITTDDIYVVKGGSRYYQGFGDPATDAILHHQVSEYGKRVPKEVRKDQPEFVCFYVLTDKTIEIQLTFYYKTGSSSSQIIIGSVAGVAGKVNIVQVGWNYLHLDDVLTDENPDKTADDIAYYEINFSGINNDVVAYRSMLYQIDDRVVDRDVYIAFFNGIGGIEVARFSGKHRKSFNAKSDMTITPTTGNHDWSKQPLGKTNAVGHESYVLNSGYIDRAYCDVLAQMNLGDAWLIDRARMKFYKIYIAGASTPISDDDDKLYSVDITYRGPDYAHYSRFNY